MAISGTSNLNWRYLPYRRPMLGLNLGDYSANLALYGTVPPFSDAEIPIDISMHALNHFICGTPQRSRASSTMVKVSLVARDHGYQGWWRQLGSTVIVSYFSNSPKNADFSASRMAVWWYFLHVLPRFPLLPLGFDLFWGCHIPTKRLL